MRGSGVDTPKIAKYRSADVSAPYILQCNYLDANIKTVNTKSRYVIFTLKNELSYL